MNGGTKEEAELRPVLAKTRAGDCAGKGLLRLAHPMLFEVAVHHRNHLAMKVLRCSHCRHHHAGRSQAVRCISGLVIEAALADTAQWLKQAIVAYDGT